MSGSKPSFGAFRDHPPEGLRRTPGPRTILYYLPRHVGAWDSGRRLPRSSRTIYQILKRHHRIASTVKPPPQEELPRQAPMQYWQIDFRVYQHGHGRSALAHRQKAAYR